MTTDRDILELAKAGDIEAFQILFAEFQPQLKSFIYRLTADRNDADDLTHDTFIKAFTKLKSFRGEASLKTWVFRIGANLAKDYLKKYRPWPVDAQDQSKALAMGNEAIVQRFFWTHEHSARGAYEIREHIDFCFTCIAKTLPISQQVALLLKDVYQFSRKEIGTILEVTEGVVKHLLYDGRRTMSQVFDQRCALVNKNGTCHQCTELAGIYNPRQAKQEELMKLAMVAEQESASMERLYALRAELVSFIDPLTAGGADLQDAIMQCTRQAIGEIEAF